MIQFRPSVALPVLGLLLALCACSSGPDRDEAGAIAEEGDLAATDIQTGDCFDEPDGTLVTEVVAIPCTQPHDNEAFIVYELDEFLAVGLDDKVAETCLPAFEEYVGLAFDASVLQINYLTPSQEGFDAGDKEVICYLTSPDGKVEGSLKGSAK